VLFSEPKIPQSSRHWPPGVLVPQFQCSSASRKFLNLPRVAQIEAALDAFQCSSASRKFLNAACGAD